MLATASHRPLLIEHERFRSPHADGRYAGPCPRLGGSCRGSPLQGPGSGLHSKSARRRCRIHKNGQENQKHIANGSPTELPFIQQLEQRMDDGQTWGVTSGK